nr:glutathione S-transferase family protein [uncultured Halomonas sp.]
MLLYGVPLSPFVRKTLFTLYELDLDFQQEFTFPQGESSAFRAASPLGRIPGFEDGEVRISDSSAICHYLIRRQNSALIDYDHPQALGRIIGWDKYADEDLSPAVFDLLVERVVKPVRFGKPADEYVVKKAIDEKMPQVFDYLQARLEDNGGPWLTGADFSFADIAVGAHMSNLVLAEVELDSNRWPVLGAWFKHLQQRPAFQRFCQEAREFKP